jgi:hypothetical protein
MFDFAFAVGVALIIPLIYAHSHFNNKIRKNIKNQQEEYAKMMAKTVVDELKRLIEKPLASVTPPYNEIEMMYTNLYKKQFDGIDNIVEAMKLENWLSNSTFLFFVASALWLFAGIFPYISIGDSSLSGFSIPSIISGVIATIIASFRIYQIGKKV